MTHTLLSLGICFSLLPTSGWAQIECSPFPFDAPTRATQSPLIDVRRADFDLALDPERRTTSGRVTFELEFEHLADSFALAAPLATIDSIFVGNAPRPAHPVTFRIVGQDTVVVNLSSLREASIEIDSLLMLSVVFRSKGVRFDGDAAWTLDNVEPWFPFAGGLGARFASEMMLTVPSEWVAAGPGIQAAERTTEDDRRTYLYSSPHPLPARRVGFAAGNFQPATSFAQLSGGRRVPVTHFDGRIVPETSELISSVSDWTAYSYPFERYSQLARTGVPLASAAGLAVAPASVILDERARADVDPSEELASQIGRQWFGTITSASGWAHAWWEVALSSYVGALVTDEDLGTYLRRKRDAYLRETSDYARPLVWHRWHHPDELHDDHARGKGAWVLHMMRRQMGEDAFRESVAHFLEENQFRSVETQDLLQAFEDVTGTDWAAFAEDWILAAGHPIFEVSYEVVPDGVAVRIAQLQQGELIPAAFDLDLTLEIGALGSTERFSVTVNERSEEFVLPFPVQPRFLAVDPESDWLLVARVHQPAPAWIAQLRNASTPDSRLSAAEALADAEPEPALLLGLRSALETEPEPVVRSGIIKAIANLSSEAAERAILSAFDDSSPLVRLTIMEVLPSLANAEDAIELALEAAQRDPSYYVQANAVRALALLESENAIDIARSALITPSHDGVIPAAGLFAFQQLHPRAPGDAFTAAVTYSGEGYSLRVRKAAVHLLGSLAAVNRQAAARLDDLLADSSFQISAEAAAELARISAMDVLRDRMGAEVSSSRMRALLGTLLPCN